MDKPKDLNLNDIVLYDEKETDEQEINEDKASVDLKDDLFVEVEISKTTATKETVGPNFHWYWGTFTFKIGKKRFCFLLFKFNKNLFS